MNEFKKISPTSRTITRPVRWLMAGTLLALSLPTLAAEAVATVKKASGPATTTVTPIVKPAIKTTPKNVSPEDEGGVKDVGPRTPPKKVLKTKPGKSNKKVKKLKTQNASSNEPVPVNNPAAKQ
jgi:hypothetical protein